MNRACFFEVEGMCHLVVVVFLNVYVTHGTIAASKTTCRTTSAVATYGIGVGCRGGRDDEFNILTRTTTATASSAAITSSTSAARTAIRHCCAANGAAPRRNGPTTKETNPTSASWYLNTRG
jgi:hypothetical protein